MSARFFVLKSVLRDLHSTSDIFVNENEYENENYCAFVHENENEIFLKNENRIRTKINLSERIEINY